MTITTFSCQEFNRDANKAQKAARNGSVFITDHGHPAHALLTIEEYQRITGHPSEQCNAGSAGNRFEQSDFAYRLSF